MSETQAENTGSTELYGRAADEAAAGHKPMVERPTPEPETADLATAREAADQLIISRAAAEPAAELAYLDAEGVRVDEKERSVALLSWPPLSCRRSMSLIRPFRRVSWIGSQEVIVN